MKRDSESLIRIELNLKRSHLAVILGAFLTGLIALKLDSESLTMTTSYPAPSGVYQSLITTGGNATSPVNTVLARDFGNVGIGTNNPKGILDVKSATSGLVLPRTSTNSVTSPAQGMLVYSTDSNALVYYDGATWRPVVNTNGPSGVTNFSGAALDSLYQNTTSKGELYIGIGFTSGTFYFQAGPTSAALADQDSTGPGGLLLGAIPPGWYYKITCKGLPCGASSNNHIVDF